MDLKEAYVQVKDKYAKLKFDFESEETPIKDYLLLSELKMFKSGVGHLID